jgi:phospholipid/cholesterol/gamma-HCH transport system ATP-binding protein
VIEIEGVEKALGGKPVLRGVDLRIETGESVVIIGRSGCGKSVLLKHIIGLLSPDRGDIRIHGRSLVGISRKELNEIRREFGMLFQGAALFDSLTVGENVALGLRSNGRLTRAEVERVVAEKLAMVGLTGVEAVKPADLSGGMRKRAGLARAIASNPGYLLYDEPTTGLDPIMADAINLLIRELQSQLSATSLVVTHDMKSAYYVGDRIAMLHEGRIIFDGTPEETKRCPDPVVQQFITGSSVGPIQI